MKIFHLQFYILLVLAATDSLTLLAMQFPGPTQETKEQFWQSIASNDLEGVKKALDGGINPNTHDDNGNTALFVVVTRRLFLDGRDRYVSPFNHDTINIVRELLRHGADPLIPNQDGLIPLDTINSLLETLHIRTAPTGRIEDLQQILSLLLEAENRMPLTERQESRREIKRLNEAAQLDGRFLRAIMDGNRDKVRTVLEDGANPNRSDTFGDTPLHYLAAGQDYHFLLTWVDQPFWFETTQNLLEELLSHGANPLARNRLGNTPLQKITNRLVNAPTNIPIRPQLERLRNLFQQAEIRARQAFQPRRQELLEVMRQPGTYLARLPAELQRELTRFDLPELVPLEALEAHTQELIIAIQEGVVAMVRQALTNAVNADATDNVGRPMLMLAALRRDPNEARQIVELLIPHLANLNPTVRGQTLLELLRQYQNRQDIIDVIANAMRARGQLVVSPPAAEPSSISSWLGRFFGSGSAT